MKWVIDSKDFSKGLATSNEGGGFFSEMRGIDIYNASEYESQADISAIGAIRAGYAKTDFGGVGVVDLIKQFVTAYDNSGGVQYLFGFGGDHAYRVNTTTDAAPTRLTLASQTDIGAALYTNGTDTRIYVAGLITIRDIGIDIFGTMSLNDPTTTGTPIVMTTGVPHPMFVKNNILWVGDKNELIQLDDTTWTDAVLDIDADYIIQSISEHDKYLAIGAMFGNNTLRVPSSRVYFWDMISDSWNFSAQLDGALVQLKNVNGVLTALTALNGGFSLLFFDGVQFKTISSRYNSGLSLSAANSNAAESTGRQVFDTDRGRFFWMIKDTELETRFGIGATNIPIDVWSYGNYHGLPTTFHKPHDVILSTEDGGNVNMGALKVGQANKVYTSYQDGASTYKLVVFKRATGNSTGAWWRTVDLDKYFNDNGRLKKMQSIRFDVDELASGDVLELYKAIDYTTDFIRLDGQDSASVENSIREADYSGDSQTTIKFTRTDTFRHLRLAGKHTGGDVRIRKIIIEFTYEEK